MESELEHQSFESDHVADMLSPKRLKLKRDPSYKPANTLYPTLPDFDFLIDEPELQAEISKFKGGTFDADNWPNSKGPENAFYPVVVKLVNSITTELEVAYTDALNAQILSKRKNAKFPQLKERAQRWFSKGLKLLECADQAVKDGVDGASPLKPDFISTMEGIVEADGRHFSWGQPNTLNKSDGQIQQVGEVKRNWPELMAQLLTYMRAMRAAFPEGLFRIGYAFCFGSQEFRVIIHHNGGITATKALDLRKLEDRIKLQKVMFSMLCWQNYADAGYTSFTNGVEYNIPHLGRWTHLSTYFQSHSGRGRATRVFKVAKQDGPSSNEVIYGKPTITLTRTDMPDMDEPVVDEEADENECVSAGMKRSHATSAGSKQAKAPTSFKILKSLTTDSPSSVSKAGSPEAKPETVYPTDGTHKWFTLEDFPPNAEWVKATVANLGDHCTEHVIKVSCPAIKDGLATELEFVEEQIRDSTAKNFTPFGLANYVCAFLPRFPEDWLSSNSIFIPHLQSASGFECFPQISDYYWHWRAGSCEDPPKHYDVRFLLVIVSCDEGQPLVKCETTDEIARCMFSVMMGYWAAFNKGWLQMDPSIGNALRLAQERAELLEKTLFPDAEGESQLAIFKRVSQAASQLVDRFRTLDSETFALHFDSASPAVQKEFKELQTDPMWLRYRLLEEAKSLQLADHCLAVQTDFDLAAKLDAYVEKCVPGPSISGTVQFLSESLLRAATQTAEPIQYFHSTIDDLWAHFYTMVWAIVNRESMGKPTDAVQRLRTQLRGSHRERGVSWVVKGPHNSQTPPIVTQVKPLLFRWQKALDSIQTKYETRLAQERGSSLRATMEFALLEGILEFILAYREWSKVREV